VKLRSGDPTWRALTALTYHYETQPLPTPLAWLAHHLPPWFHQMSCALMFVIELPVPFLMLASPPVSYIAGVLTIALMLLVMATGNYCFFNLLAIALSLLLFDDAVWRHVLPAGATVSSRWPWWALVPMAFVLLVLSVRRVVYLFGRDVSWPRSLERLFAWLEPFHLVSGYGLFAVMTTTRPEIIVEGSDDGATWKPYEFKWKPDDPTRPPRYCMPHQPRLDWQMWFAALGDYRRYPWFIAFLARLLEPGKLREARAIAVDERSAALVEPDGKVKVEGEGMVYFVRANGPAAICKPGAPLTFRGISVYRVPAGGSFDLRSWTGHGGAAYELNVDSGVIRSTQEGGGIY